MWRHNSIQTASVKPEQFKLDAFEPRFNFLSRTFANFMTKPVLSIVIPTRSRARYLRHALATATAVASDAIEIVVSDNCSTDDTADIMAAVEDPRIRYVQTPDRLPIAGSMEFAFSQATGRYLLYRGDEDAVVPSGIERLLRVLETGKVDIVTWPEISYNWPGVTGPAGFLKLTREMIEDRSAEGDAGDAISNIIAGRHPDHYFHLGCFSQEVYQAVLSRMGRFFYHVDPGTSGLLALHAAAQRGRPFIQMSAPATVYGRSPASTTLATQMRPTAASGTDETDAFEAFLKEYEGRAGAAAVPPATRSIWLFALDGVLKTMDALDRPRCEVNTPAFVTRIRRELERLLSEVAEAQRQIANTYLEDAGLNALSPIMRYKTKGRSAVTLSFLPIRPSKSSLRLHHRSMLANVFDAAMLADRLLFGRHSSSWLGLALNASKALLGPSSPSDTPGHR